MIMPWIVLAAGSAAIYARLMRSSLSETMREDYIRTARAKGLRERAVVRQGVRSAINPIVTLFGLEIGVLLGGAILVETVFNIPGIGSAQLSGDPVRRLPRHPGDGAARLGVHHHREHRRGRRLRVSRPSRSLLMSATEPLLRVEELRVEFPTEDGVVHAVDGITYQVHAGRTLGIVGESGSGKTVSSLTTLGLTRRQGARISGRILFEGQDLVILPEERLRAIRGNDIAMVFQDPLSSLHPLYKVGKQLIEAVQAHRDVSKATARNRAIELLGLVGIPDPSRRVDQYPHEFSGGMRQRVMIAMALANEPKLLIADEPTTALDVTVQAQILGLMERLQRELGMAIVIITHDLGVVAEMADDIAVMYAGRIVETASAARVFAARAPLHVGPACGRSRGSTARAMRTSCRSRAPRRASSTRPRAATSIPAALTREPEHSRIDPALEPVPDEPSHHVACLLEPAQATRAVGAAARGRHAGAGARRGRSAGGVLVSAVEPTGSSSRISL